jgi:hypothetical protein
MWVREERKSIARPAAARVLSIQKRTTRHTVCLRLYPYAGSSPPGGPPPLPLGALLVVAAAELGIIIILNVRLGRRGAGGRGGRQRGLLGGRLLDVHKVAGVEGGVLVLAYQLAEGVVGGIDEVEGGEAALVLGAGVGAGLEHHVDEGVAEFAVRGGFGVDPADGGVEGGVALAAADGVAFEVWLVEEEVDDFVWRGGELVGGGDLGGREGDGQLPWEAASW